MPPETLIDGYTFLVTAESGEFGPRGGLFHRDTRYLSAFDVSVGERDLTQIGETLVGANERVRTAATTSPGVNAIDEGRVPKHAEVVVERRQSVHEGAGYVETVTVANHAAGPRSVDVTVSFDADFADLFEVRGLETGIDRTVERRSGERAAELAYSYEATDGAVVERTTTVRFDRAPGTLTPHEARFATEVAPQGTVDLTIAVVVDAGPEGDPDGSPQGSQRSDTAERLASHTPESIRRPRDPPVTLPRVQTGRIDYDETFERAATDLTALTTATDHGPVALAGTPWFATPFGRDAILTAHQTLAVAPALAAGTLRYFAAHRGASTDATREEEPGKVFHELRHGELASTGRIPHTPYFGTVDATPLWVLLLAETCRWRDDDSLARELARPLAEALEWTRRASEQTSKDPFVYYAADSGPLTHKAWKDTADSVRFADGEVATGELAVAEVQGYAAAALQRGGDLLEAVGRGELAPVDPDTYRARGRRIERAFDREFWLPDRTCYALARDGAGRVADAVASNVGHCLWTGTIPEGRAAAVVETIVDGPLNSGWGLRTMSPADAGYSPVSYHAGGVWPHDTSLVALGLAKYGYGDAAEELAAGVLDAATHFRHHRLPELYCGFGPDRTPTTYPAACTPQAWAAGAPYAFLRAVFDARPAGDGEGVEVSREPSLFDESAAAAFE
jgi:glycogen debranching enzyme